MRCPIVGPATRFMTRFSGTSLIAAEMIEER
jgi:hypothetical protein